MITIDIAADLNDEDETGFVWTYLDEARDPALIRPGNVVIAGDVDAPAVCEVIDLVVESSGTIVHLRLLPGTIEDYEALVRRSGHPSLTPCQRRRIRDFLRDALRSHEEGHARRATPRRVDDGDVPAAPGQPSGEGADAAATAVSPCAPTATRATVGLMSARQRCPDRAEGAGYLVLPRGGRPRSGWRHPAVASGRCRPD